MDRKEFIKKSLLLGLGLPFASSLFQSCEKDLFYPQLSTDFNGKIIIIGAGAAGLSTGHLLHQYGIDFEILEAGTTFGGRIERISNFTDFPIDLGAEWIDGGPQVLSRILNDSSVQSNIAINPYSPDSIYMWQNGKLNKSTWISNFYADYKFKSTTWFGFFEKYIVPKIQDKITYKCIINEINYENDKVILKNNEGTIYEADKVLITVPTKILQNRTINFIPPLPDIKTAAIDNIKMPSGIKIFIEFSKNFYPDLILFDGIINALRLKDKVIYNAAFKKISNKNIMGILAIGNQAKKYTSLGTELEIINKILSELDEVFDGKATLNYLRYVIKNWSNEPHIQGAYSTEYDGDKELIINDIQTPLNHKVYFAGESLSKENNGTVRGASESGYNAIKQMLSEKN